MATTRRRPRSHPGRKKGMGNLPHPADAAVQHANPRARFKRATAHPPMTEARSYRGGGSGEHVTRPTGSGATAVPHPPMTAAKAYRGPSARAVQHANPSAAFKKRSAPSMPSASPTVPDRIRPTGPKAPSTPAGPSGGMTVKPVGSARLMGRKRGSGTKTR